MRRLFFFFIFFTFLRADTASIGDRFANICDVFPSSVYGYSTVQLSNSKICGSSSIYSDKTNTLQSVECYTDKECLSNVTCDIKSLNAPKFTPILLTSALTYSVDNDCKYPNECNFTHTDYTSNTNNFNNMTPSILIFDANETCPYDANQKCMTFGDITLQNKNFTLKFYPGDYYFNSLIINSDTKIILPEGGDVRIFVKNDFKIMGDINRNGDSHNLFIYSGGSIEVDRVSVVRAYLYAKGEFRANLPIILYGALTAERNINGNNGIFIYDGSIGDMFNCTEHSQVSLVTGTFNVVESNFDSDTDPIDPENSLNQIFTKIANKPFSVKVLKLNKDYQTLENYSGVVEVDLIKNPSNQYECDTNPTFNRYFLFFNQESVKEINNIIYSGVLKEARFRVRYLTDAQGNMISDNDNACLDRTNNCVWGLLTQIATTRYGDACPTGNIDSDYCDVPCAQVCNYKRNRTGGGGDVPSDECLECIFDNYSNKVCSRDDFSIRPAKYKLSNIDSVIKAGEEFNITLEALDYNGNLISNANFNDDIGLSAKDLKASCRGGKFTNEFYNANFVNGVAHVSVAYNEVGEINASVREIKDTHEFASVDENDSGISEDILLISPGYGTFKLFVPYKFVINGGFYNFNKGKFTYISNTLKMSAFAELNITAYTKNSIAKNYNALCYAKNFDLNVSYKYLDVNNFPIDQKVSYEVNQTGKENNISLNQVLELRDVSKNFFSTDTNGSAIIHLLIGFTKKYSYPVNEFNVTLREVNVSDENSTFGSADINVINPTYSNATYRYGRIRMSNIAGYGNELNGKFTYLYWNNDEWVLNKDHNNNDGNITSVVKPDDVVVELNPVIKGEENVTFKTTHILPYSVKIHLGINSWLWYHPLAITYKDPSEDESCFTHPCVKVDFLMSSKGWSGVKSISNEKFNETNRTVDVNITPNEENVTKSQVKKLNW